MKKLILGGCLLAACVALPLKGRAQPTAHYVPGIEGIKGASLPPPGVYIRDYNVFYWSDRLNGPDGREIDAANAHAFIYANVPRLIWITKAEVLGGNIGVDGLVPLQYTQLKANTAYGPFDESTFGVGDLFAEVTWSRHWKMLDLGLGYGFWAPTGNSDQPLTTEPGLGSWGQMLTAGATLYFDSAKKWSLSALNRYEFNYESRDTGITPGQAYTLEWGLGYSFSPLLEAGLVGYYQAQMTGDKGPNAAPYHDSVVGIGGELVSVCPRLGVQTSLRYVYEVVADNRLQGHTVSLNFTKRF